jgi:hypothetical protein
MAGCWLDDERMLGFEVGGFFLQTVQNSFATFSNGSPFLGRPINEVTFGEIAQPVAQMLIPGVLNLAGGFTSTFRSSLWGAEANLRSCLLCCDNFFIDGLVGYRMLGLDEDLRLRESPTLSGVGISSQSNPIEDRFQTGNRFYGGQFGGIAEYRLGPWSFNVQAKLGLGVTQQTVKISGSTTTIDSLGNTAFAGGGLLALPTNIGNHSRSAFSVVPELGLNVGYQVTANIRAFVGYNFLYWSDVVRPGQQIDRVVNLNNLPHGTGVGPARPAFAFNSSTFWAQGANCGVEIRW